MKYFGGIDIGASTTKVVLLNGEKKILGYSVNTSGADFRAAADRAFQKSREIAGLKDSDDCAVIATGYGRNNVPNTLGTRTEISCHAKGSFHHFPQAHTLIDIGGQDSKVIKVDIAGKRVNFKMNRKCAAGTGAFLEEMANRLHIKLDKLNELAEKAEKNVQIGSYCTVFAATEILAKIRQGIPIPDIVKGVFDSVLKRVIEMDPLEGDIVMTGGVVEYFPFLVKMFEERIGRRVFVPPHPQLTGAFGAALYTIETAGEKNA